MSLVKCATIGCRHHVRQGLKRYGQRGCDGQALAYGLFCWRCRYRNDREATAATPRPKRVAR